MSGNALWTKLRRQSLESIHFGEHRIQHKADIIDILSPATISMSAATRVPRPQTERERRRVYLAFEFNKDAQRRTTFLSQADAYCDYRIEDLSLPSAVHDSRWQREALKRIQSADVVIVLLGPDTYNAPGVLDELSLAGQVTRPVVQLMAQRRKYGLVSHRVPVCSYKWKRINEMLRHPETFAAVGGNFMC